MRGEGRARVRDYAGPCCATFTASSHRGVELSIPPVVASLAPHNETRGLKREMPSKDPEAQGGRGPSGFGRGCKQRWADRVRHSGRPTMEGGHTSIAVSVNSSPRARRGTSQLEMPLTEERETGFKASGYLLVGRGISTGGCS